MLSATNISCDIIAPDQGTLRIPCERGCTDLVICARRNDTQKQYKVYLAKWRQFRCAWKIDPFSPPLDFFAQLFNEGKQYSAINTPR